MTYSEVKQAEILRRIEADLYSMGMAPKKISAAASKILSFSYRAASMQPRTVEECIEAIFAALRDSDLS